MGNGHRAGCRGIQAQGVTIMGREGEEVATSCQVMGFVASSCQGSGS